MKEDLVERVRTACLKSILEAYEAAGAQGLCAEGRWEAVVGALRSLNLTPWLRESAATEEIDGTPEPGE